ncbi:nickel-dependent hydrogenase large subunit [Pseudooceanicola sp. CBS1P-1]|uniref:Uptake hydrogenase large subunit n=1 Tax=Pseudooceanicola albus TaxID=2692189 RepID=A0A6L7G9H4_9RHOB|nr:MULTISPECIES: nickel-dependent hydrogenase large subunit [Pseudooceanicola]MBT9386262.1 nickel-dependent hydrogenase large subunit [Pseudooceanicola endophyticus]MXN20312.1 hydrogenase 1 large subunit [Pseudooceanicola albus]
MSKTIVVDPLTRIEGHLRIEAGVDETGRVISALSSGTQVRGIEIILKGRDPRDAWAFAQRICGVCTLVHGLASVRAVEDALKIEIPENAQLIRNLMAGCQLVQDHVMHFYHLQAMDWVNPVSALKADPAEAARIAAAQDYPESSLSHFTAVQAQLKTLVDSGQLGIFRGGFWDHPGYRLSPEVNLIVLSHYLDGLKWQRDVGKIMAIFGGKDPHPNLVVGGVPCAIAAGEGDLPGGGDGTAVNLTMLQKVQALITQMNTFVSRVYLPDLELIAGAYSDWFTRGEGVRNFLAYGDFGGTVDNGFGVPRGVVLNRDLTSVRPIDLGDQDQIREFISNAWYSYEGGKDQGLHPYAGETTLAYDGPQPPFANLSKAGGYSWLKSPRWREHPIEVGPLARLVVMRAAGEARSGQLTDQILGRLGLPFEAVYSTMGRILARGIEAQIMCERMQVWQDRLMANIAKGDLKTFDGSAWNPSKWPKKAQGVGYVEAPRGSLAHWITFEDGKITNYQAVVPTTWNAGPVDPMGQPGPYEAALLDDHTLAIPDQPLELLRTIHSFDPCMACAAHVLGGGGEEIVSVKIA